MMYSEKRQESLYTCILFDAEQHAQAMWQLFVDFRHIYSYLIVNSFASVMYRSVVQRQNWFVVRVRSGQVFEGRNYMGEGNVSGNKEGDG